MLPVLAQISQLDELDGLLNPGELTAADWIAAAAILVGSVVASIVIGRVVSRVIGSPGGRSEQVAKLVARALRWLIQLIGIAWALSQLGLDLGWFTVALALLLVVLFMAGRPLIESLAAGFVLTARPAFTIGDDVVLQEQYSGRVLEITGRSTVLLLRDGTRVHVPNISVTRETVKVLTGHGPRRSHVEIEIDEQHPIHDVALVIIDAIEPLDSVLDDPPPRVRARGFGPASVRLSIRFWHEPSLRGAALALDDVVRAVQTALRDAGIATSAPQHVVRLESAGDDPL